MHAFRSAFLRVLPKSRWEWVLYGFVLLCALRPWIVGWILFPHDPPSVRVIYRSSSGDTEYFPMINALAKGNLGEGAVYEAQGSGMIPFPVASVIFHAAGTALMGPLAGYIVADIIVTFLFFFSFHFWCRLFSSHELWTTFLAALFACGLPQLMDGIGLHLIHIGGIWGERIPRPFVSDIYFTAGMGLFTWMAWNSSARSKITSWLMLGAIMALALQSFIYFLPTFGAAAAFIAVQWIWEDKRAFSIVLSRIGYSLASFLVLASPFFLQRLLESPEAALRMGLITVDRWNVLLHTPWAKDPCVLVGLLILVIFALSNATAVRLGLSSIPGKVLGLLATMQVAAFLGLPLVAVLTGHLIQEYHFALITTTVQAFLLAALVARFGPSTLPKILLHPAPATAVLLFGYLLPPYHVVHQRLLVGPLRTDMYSFHGPDYHQAFTALTRELDRDVYRDSQVVATIDDQVFAYWVGFRGRSSFMPKAWNTALSSQEIEDRMLWFAREERLDAASLARLLSQRTVLYYWFSGDAKPDEMENVQARYAQVLAKGENEKPRLDLIVLTNDAKLFPLPDPDPSRYALTYHDDYFRVWKAIKPSTPDGK